MIAYLTTSIVRYFNAVVFMGIVLGLSIFTVVIGVYNYNTSMTDLRNKASNTADLAAISLREPLWNYDVTGLQDIFAAILLDHDVIGISVTKAGEEKADQEKMREGLGQTSFAELLKNPLYIENVGKIMREGKEIAKVQIITSTEKVQAIIRYTSMLISMFALVFVGVISTYIWYLGGRLIQRPINSLRNSADQLAGGNLTYPINTSRKDELGSLAVSFDRMRNAIRQKLADLAILNNTGEVMAGIHDQMEALETAIKVMSDQTHVERGSIYLMDPDSVLTLSAFYPDLEGSVTHFPKSFKLSEGIAGQAATSGHVVFVPDVTKVPNYVATSANEKPKALLCVPMMDDKTVFGVMNFVGEVGKVDFTADDEGFALTIARMAVITIKNIQMLKVIEEQNRTLEERILARTAELRQKTNDVNNMLQNMRQGIFTIVKGATIHPEFSAFLSEIYESKEVADAKVFPFLFDRSSVGGDVLNQMEATLDSLIGEDAMNFEFNSHLLVTEYTKMFDGERQKIIELDWNPVLDSNDLIDKLMVTARDVTAFRALQLEAAKQKEELDVIGQILGVSKAKLLEFISTSYEFMDENKALIEKNSAKDLDVVAALFRNMHTVKGNARTYGLAYITDRVHEAESTYSQLRSEDDFPWDQAQLLEQLQAARVCVNRYENVFNEKLAGFVGAEGSGGGGGDSSVIDAISKAVESLTDLSHAGAVQDSIRSIKNSINRVRTESVQDVLQGIVDGVPSMAKQLDKEAPEIVITDNDVRLKKDIVPMLRNVFMHVFRNSMDHGLETTAQRIASGKSEKGRIKLDVTLNADQLTFAFSDDGKGLALGHIHRKAISNGQLTADQKVTDGQIAEMIFLSGLSTATEVTNVSGRGVGMDAIRQFLNKHHGDVQIEFTGESVTPGFRPFQLSITLPAKFAVSSS